jgi:hypothetical protein
MSNKKDNKELHVNLCHGVAAATIFFLELYSDLNIDFVSMFHASGVFLYFLKAFSFLLHWAIFSGLYFGLYQLFLKIKQIRWKKKAPNCNLEGAWLHIHEKDCVRIGVADITQDFYDIKVHAENLKPHVDNSNITTWHYIGTEFRPDENSNIKLMGCYYAHRQGDESKQGVHLFTKVKTQDGKVWKMTGEFGDVLKENAKETTLGDRAGKIYFFRMTPELKEYIGYKSVDEYDKDKLIWIMNATQETNPAVFNSDFVKMLKKVYNRVTFQCGWKEFREKYVAVESTYGISLHEIETTVYNLIACSMYVDGQRLDAAEKAMLKDLTGMNLTILPRSAYNKNLVFRSIKSILEKLSQYRNTDLKKDPFTLFKNVLDSSCRSIILSNLEQSERENTFIKDLEHLIESVCEH